MIHSVHEGQLSFIYRAPFMQLLCKRLYNKTVKQSRNERRIAYILHTALFFLTLLRISSFLLHQQIYKIICFILF